MTYLSVPLEMLDNAGAVCTWKRFALMGVDEFPSQEYSHNWTYQMDKSDQVYWPNILTYTWLKQVLTLSNM